MSSLIEYIEIKIEEIEKIRGLWGNLNIHHKEQSKFNKSRYEKLNFDTRKNVFIEKSQKGKMFIIGAFDKEKNDFIGYCVNSFVDEIGEIESLFVLPDYRGEKIGETLMNISLEWINSNSPKEIELYVAEGNEHAFGFYKKFGFYPRATLLKQIK